MGAAVEEKDKGQGPKFFVNIEDVEKPWSEPEITTEQIRALAGWDPTQEVVEVDLEDSSEQALANGATIELKPGHGFAKKVKFQRG